MAKGWPSLHPFQEQRLRAIGLSGKQIRQGVATTEGDLTHPSKGSHDSVGVREGRRFGHCVDLSISFEPNRANFDRLVKAGFCPFYRGPGWASYHWHIVDVAWIKNDAGIVPRHLAIPRGQVQDFLKVPPRNGLIGHAVLAAEWAPTKTQQAYLRSLWEKGLMPEGYASQEGGVMVIYPPDAGAAGVIACVPELVNGKLRGNLAEFAEALGLEVIWNAAQRKGYVRKRDA